MLFVTPGDTLDWRINVTLNKAKKFAIRTMTFWSV